MNLLHVIPSMNPIGGGPSQGIRNQAQGMVDMDITREVVSFDSPDSDFIKKESFKIHALGGALGPWRYNAKLIPWLKQNIQRFDVIIVHGLWLYHNYAVWKVIKQLKKDQLSGKNIKKNTPPVLLMPHGMLDPYFQRAKERRVKAIRNWIFWKLIDSKIVNDVDGLLFTCQTELVLARTTFKDYRPKAEYNVGYGIVVPPVEREEMKAAFAARCPNLKNEPYLLFLSRIHQKKGIDLLIKVYQQLLEDKTVIYKLPKLVIAGPGIDTTYGKMLVKLVDGSNELKNLVYFTSMLTGEAKWGAFYGCEAFVLPSHQENFGIAVAEALACGKPVLLSDQVNIWREVDAESGGIISTDTFDGVFQLLNSWLELKPQERILMGQNAEKTFNKYFTVDKMSQNIYIVYY